MIMLRRQSSFEYLATAPSPTYAVNSSIASAESPANEKVDGSGRGLGLFGATITRGGQYGPAAGGDLQSVSPRPFLGATMDSCRVVDSVDVASDQNLLLEQDILVECLKPLLHRKRPSSDLDDVASANHSSLDDYAAARGKRSKRGSRMPLNYDQVVAATAASAAGFKEDDGDQSLDSGGSFPEDHQQDRKGSDVDLKDYQTALWQQRFSELCEYQKIHGNCNVPHTWTKNPSLAKWIKRQRYQYKLKNLGKHSTLTDERERALEGMGFIWDSHKATWEEKFEQLLYFKRQHGHCSVPSKYKDNHSLSVWVQCQRRQYRLFQGQRERSSMNAYRIAKLESIGFEWIPAGNKNRPSSSSDNNSIIF